MHARQQQLAPDQVAHQCLGACKKCEYIVQGPVLTHHNLLDMLSGNRAYLESAVMPQLQDALLALLKRVEQDNLEVCEHQNCMVA